MMQMVVVVVVGGLFGVLGSLFGQWVLSKAGKR